MCTTNYIAIFGDLKPSLIFHVVGGINFLAGDDVDYYIHSKLDEPYRSMNELDEDAFEEWLAGFLYKDLIKNDKPVPENFDEDRPSLKVMLDWYENDEDQHYSEGSDAISRWEMLCEHDNELAAACDIISTYDENYCDIIPSIIKMDSSVKFALYMVNEAAKRILKQIT